MKRFSKSSLNKLRKGEIIQFMRNVVQVYQLHDIVNLQLEEHIKTLDDSVNDLSATHKNRADTDKTEGLKQLDKERMSKLKGIRMFLHSQFRILDGEQKEAARILMNNYDDHISNRQSSSAQEKTANIISLLNDWKQDPDLNAAVQTLAMSSLTDRIAEVNDKYDQKYIERSLTDKILKMTDVKRGRIMDLFMDLYYHTEAHAMISDQKLIYRSILSEVNLLVKNYKSSVNMRYALKKRDKKNEAIKEKNTDNPGFTM